MKSRYILLCLIIVGTTTVVAQSRNLEIISETNRAVPIHGKSISWSPDSSYLAIGSNNKIYILGTKEFDLIKILSAKITDIFLKVSSVAFSPDGRLLVSGHEEGQIFIWSTETWDNVMAPWGMPWTLSCGPVPSIDFNPNGSLLASGDWNDWINIWSTKNWRNEFFSARPPRDKKSEEFSILRSNQIRSIDFSPDGKYLVTAGNDAIVRIWSTETWVNIKSLERHEHWISSVNFSPDGKYLASADHNGVVLIRGTDNWNVVRNFSDHNLRCLCVGFSPDGKLLASGGDDGELFIYQTDTWQLLKELKGHINSVISVDFSPDGIALASSSLTKINIWNTDDWQIIKNFRLIEYPLKIKLK